MHSEGHIVAHLHIQEIEHDHHTVLDDEAVAHTTCINPDYLALPHQRNQQQCKNYTPRTPSTTGLLEPCESESSLESSIVVHTAVCESSRPSERHKADHGNLEICANIARQTDPVGCDGDTGDSSRSTLGEVGAQEIRRGEGEQGIRGVDEANPKRTVGHSRRDYLDAGDIVFHTGDRHRTKWEEAAIFVKEGEDNEKFNHHPQGRWSKIAFKILHHPAYYITHLIVTILLMLLALAENYPAPRDGSQISDQARLSILMVDTGLEFLFLAFIAVYIILKLIWFGPRQFIMSKTTVFNTLVLIAMVLEAITVVARQESHIRITRALRPLFFIDNLLMDGVRREIRDILKSLKPIVDVLMLLLFIMFMFALLGYYLLAEVDPSYFDSFKKSFISLFILKTTANNPDIMLESYYEHPISVVYFTLYLIITLYCINNVLLAVVYSSFSDAEMMKFKQLYLHKRKALQLAYNTLAGPEGVSFHDFLPFVQHYRPRLTEFEVMCMFKALHKDTAYVHPYQGISREEFYSFYEVQGMRWKQTQNNQKIPWYEEIACQSPVKACHQLVKSKIFKAIVNLIVLINVIAFAIYALIVDDCPPEDRFKKLRQIYPLSMAFSIIYCAEIILKIIGLGPHNYYRKPWNVIDTLILLVSLVCLLLEVDSKLAFLALVRPIKLLRLLRLKRRYRDIMSTIVHLAPKMLTVAVFLVIVYYFFAIIGIEFLTGKVFKGCCNESWFGVGAYYVGNIAENTTDSINPAASDIFYILHFDDILNSYVTLFALMVVNNWFIIMEGFASQVEQDWLVRVYFLSFNIVSMLIFEVVISFIVEAFVFKMLARQRSRVCPTHNKPYCQCKCVKSCDHKKKVTITLLQADVDEIKQEYDSRHTNSVSTTICTFAWSHIKLWKENLLNAVSKTYVGKRHKTKDDIQLQMYRPLLHEWIKEAEEKKVHDHETDSSERESKPPKAVLLKYISNLYDYITE